MAIFALPSRTHFRVFTLMAGKLHELAMLEFANRDAFPNRDYCSPETNSFLALRRVVA